METTRKRRKLADARTPEGQSVAELIISKYADPRYFGTLASRAQDAERLVRSGRYTDRLRKQLCDILVRRFSVLVGSVIPFWGYSDFHRKRKLTKISSHGGYICDIRFHFDDLPAPYTFHSPTHLLGSADTAQFLWKALQQYQRSRELWLLALHPRVGRNSPLCRFSQQVLFDPNLIRAIFQTL